MRRGGVKTHFVVVEMACVFILLFWFLQRGVPGIFAFFFLFSLFFLHGVFDQPARRPGLLGFGAIKA